MNDLAFKQKKALVGLYMREEQKEQCARALCYICVHRRWLNQDYSKKMHMPIVLGDMAVRYGSEYCSLGHIERDFDCKDFETTNDLVRNMIISAVLDEYYAKQAR